MLPLTEGDLKIVIQNRSGGGGEELTHPLDVQFGRNVEIDRCTRASNSIFERSSAFEKPRFWRGALKAGENATNATCLRRSWNVLLSSAI